MLCVEQAFKLKSLPVQEAETLNPFPQLKKALHEPPRNARMEVSVTTSFSTHAATNVNSLHNNSSTQSFDSKLETGL